MNQKIPCELIEDLLPLYVDNLTQENTNEEIKGHLNQCRNCTDKYEKLKNPMKNLESQIVADEKEINYLRKIKKNNRHRIIISVLGTIAVIVIAIYAKLFIIGSPIYGYYADIKIENNIIQIDGTITDSASVYTRYKVKSEGETEKIIIYAALSSPWNRNGSFHIEYISDGKTVEIDGNKVTPGMKIITKQAEQLYASKNPYVGDMSSNARIAELLGIGADLGRFENQLETSKTPYSWTLDFKEDINKDNEAKFNENMKAYATVLLALVENCDEIKWSYVCEGSTFVKSLDTKEVSKSLGKDIKSYGGSSYKIQELLDLEGIR